MGKLRFVWMAALSVLCTACGKPWASVEERVNDAIPLSAVAAESQVRLFERLKDLPDQQRQIEAELATRMKIRALSCAQGKEPSIFDSAVDIRKALPADCFRTYDEGLAAWMGSRRVHMLLLAPPLRPIAEELPPILTTANNVGGLEFASHAGVAVASGAEGMEV